MPGKTKRCPKCGRTHPLSVRTCDCGATLPDRVASPAQDTALRDAVKELLTPWFLANYVSALVGLVSAGALILAVGVGLLDRLDTSAWTANGDFRPEGTFGVLLLAALFVALCSMVASVGAYLIRQVLVRRKVTWKRVGYYAGFGAVWWMPAGMILAVLYPLVEALTFGQDTGNPAWPWLQLGICLLVIALPTAGVSAGDGGQ